MFNLSGGEIVVILVLALIVIGPEKLPEALRKAGQAYAELRKLSAGFQAELQDNLGEPLRAVQDTVNMMRADVQSVVNSVTGSLEPKASLPPADAGDDSAPSADAGGDAAAAEPPADAAPAAETPADIANGEAPAAANGHDPGAAPEAATTEAGEAEASEPS